MKDREIVRMAYRLILGREPESESVLDREFDDIYELRKDFMDSEEFLNLYEKISITPSSLHTQTSICKTNENKIISNFRDYDEFLNEVDKYFQINVKTGDLFLNSCSINLNAFYILFGESNPYIDKPFSDEYKNWEMSFYEFLSGEKYAFTNEGFRKKHLKNLLHPESNNTIDKKILILQSQARLLIRLGDIKGKNILEMGCGSGRLALFFESCGCDYYAVDASKAFVMLAKKQIYSSKIKKQIINESFYAVSKFNQIFDIVVFEASFHHCDDPVKILKLLHKNTSSNATIVFLKEPISNDFDRPYGIVRQDGATALCIRRRRWLEYGYRLDFFEKLLLETGWLLNKNDIFSYEGEKAYIAKKYLKT